MEIVNVPLLTLVDIYFALMSSMVKWWELPRLIFHRIGTKDIFWADWIAHKPKALNAKFQDANCQDKYGTREHFQQKAKTYFFSPSWPEWKRILGCHRNTLACCIYHPPISFTRSLPHSLNNTKKAASFPYILWVQHAFVSQ